MREVHADEPPTFELHACRAGPVLVFLLALLVAEDVGDRAFLVLGLVLALLLARFGGHGPSAAIVVGEGLGIRAAAKAGVRLARAGDDLVLGHAEIGRGGIAGLSPSDKPRQDAGASRSQQQRAKSRRRRKAGAHDLLLAPKSGGIMANGTILRACRPPWARPSSRSRQVAPSL